MAKSFVKGSSLMLFDDKGHSYAFATNHTLTVSTETQETSTKDNGQYGHVEITKYNWEITTENLYTVDEFGILFDQYIAGEPVKIRFGVKSQTDETKTVYDGDYPYWTSGEEFYEGECLLTNLTVNAQNGETASYSATFSGQGKLAHMTGQTPVEPTA